MTDESNGESTFEFVDKRVDDLAISSNKTKTGKYIICNFHIVHNTS